MKKMVLAFAAVGILASVPAYAQQLRVGPGGVTIENDDDDRYDRRRYDERRMRDRRGDRDEPRAYRRDDCQIVTTRRERANGSVYVTRERVCD